MSNDLSSALSKNPVAIVGMGAIFPQSKNLSEYWDNIVHEIDCITEVPPSRWNIDDYYDPDPTIPDKTYCKKGGFLPDIDFNPLEFGLPPNILEVTDAGQLLSLVVAKQTLADAGYSNMSADMRNQTGCILGVAAGQKLIVPLASRLQYPIWDRVLESSGIDAADREKIITKMKLAYVPWEENSFPGLLANVISGRVANRFDLGGTNCVVDAACAASLAAVRMAVGELVDGRTDAMLTGGVDCDNSIFAYMSFSKTPAFSKKNHIRPFDADSDGMMIGEGVGMLMLRRLADAERDGDRIYAVIKGIGSSSDGRYKSIYAPRSSGQAKAVARAYEDAGVDPATIGIVEAHGTGTPAGDPTEFAGLNEVFSHNNPQRQYIGLGSVKSQIGHTKAAAGSASLIKIALALHHKILPPSIKIEQPHPKLDIENTPFYLNAETRPWIKPTDSPRRAGVSAFGFGGTNFHFVLEEYTPDHVGSYRIQSVAKSVLIAGRTAQAVVASCKLHVASLQRDEAVGFAALPFGRPKPYEARVGFVAENAKTALAHLQTTIKLLEKNLNVEHWEHPKGIFYRRQGLETDGKIVALFPGQGSQYVNMGKTVTQNFAAVREGFGRIDSQRKDDPLSRTVYPIPVFDDEKRKVQANSLRATENAQPAIGTLSYGFYKLLQNAGFKPDFAAGHSFGELTALWAAGVLNDDDYFYLINERGRAMAAPDNPNFDAGTMLAVKGNISQLKRDMPHNVTIANHNSHSQVVLAGSKAAIANAERVLDSKGYKVTPLPVSAAFHTEFVGHAQKPFARAIDQVQFNKPKIAVYSNSTGNVHHSNPQAIKQSLKGHILQPVLFAQEIENIYAAGGTIFVEIGPRRILTSLVEDILENRPHVAIALNASRDKDSDLQLREAYTRLAVLGLPLDALDPHQREMVDTSAKASPINVSLSGNNYVSPKTQAAYQDALNDGFKITANSVATVPLEKKIAPTANSNGKAIAHPKINPPPVLPPVPSKPIAKPAPQAVTKKVKPKKQSATPVVAASKPTRTQPSVIKRTMSDNQLERSLALLHQHQAETLRVHEAFLGTQETYSAQVFALLRGSHRPLAIDSQQAVTLPQNKIAAKPVKVMPAPTPVPVAERKVDAPPPTPKPVEMPRVMPSAPIAEMPVSGNPHQRVASSDIPETQAPQVADLADAMLEIVSEKTGYPAEMLELSMDMESDLGIDSIKRVEILGAMQEQHPDLPSVDPSELSELRTLQEIVDHLSQAMRDTPSAASQHTNEGHALPNETQTPQVADLADAMLEIVSEKTGYPAEMLELSMDMESDLGIDSIKRVEILGAMQEQHPELPSVDPSELSELRTLQEIVNHLGQATGGFAPSMNGHSNDIHATLNGSYVSGNPHAPTDIPETQTSHVAGLADAMLEIVSEKTGYPAEMLELSMDMESDLGIDSIKRVEILGAMQEQHPELPSVDPSELSELRTLEEIVNHLQLATHNAVSPKADAAVAGAAQNHVVDSVPAPKNHAITRQIVQLKTLPMVDFMEIAQPVGYVCLVTESEIGRLLANELTLRGWTVEMLTLSATFDESKLKAQLGRFAKVNAFVHVNEGDAETQLKQVFFIAKHLKERLTEAADETRPAFVTATCMDGSLGLAGNDFDPVHGGLFGLTKTLRLEWPRVYCRAVDLHPEISSADAASYVLAELFDPNKLVSEVGYGQHGRVTLTTDEVALGTFTPSAEITQESVFVVSGGAKGITADCVLYLAKQYQCKFILLGRSALNAVDDSWLGQYANEAELKRLTMQQIIAQGEKPTPMAVNKLVKRIKSQREIAGTLAALRAVGSAAEYISVDVTDATAMQRELGAAQQRLGQITGVIHGAGVLSDKLIEKKTEWDFDSVYDTKVKGLNALLSAVSLTQLRHLVLFSSAAGFFGNAGQADYAIANDILNKFAHWANANYPNCHTVAIDWGPWDGGMVTPTLKKLFAERNVPIIPIEVGAWILANELNENVSQIIVGGELIPAESIRDLRLQKHRIHRHLRLDANPFLHDHVIGGNPVLPTVCAITWMANGCEQLYPGYTLFACDNYQVLKGIVFEPGLENRACVLELEEVEKSPESICVKAMIRSQTADGKPRFHYRAEITLLKEIPDVPLFTEFDLSEGETHEGHDLYGSAVFHGPSFQGVQQVVNVTPASMTMRCRLATVSAETQGQFPVQNFNPFIADGQYQSMVIWVWRYHDEAGSLPLMTKHGEQYRPIPFDTTAYTTMLVTGSTESKLICDLIAHDENGLVYSHVKGATVTISKALRELFIPATSLQA